jgi:hypothetical protein
VSLAVGLGSRSCAAGVGVDSAGRPGRGEAKSETVRKMLGGCAVESKIVKLILSTQKALCNIFASLCGPYLLSVS